MMMMVPVAILL